MAKKRQNGQSRVGIVILIIVFIILGSGLIALVAKVKYDLKHPFSYSLTVTDAKESGSKPAKMDKADGSISVKDEIGYIVDISKHWQNNPDTPLMTYGAQYDNTVVNDSDYDIVDWSVVIVVPENNITIDSYWNGEWEYDKQASTIDFTPDERIETILAGDTATFGSVMISRELMKFTDVTFTGKRYRPITKYFLFWVIMVLLIAWFTSVIAYVLYLIRDNNYRKNAQRLNDVISQTMTTFANFIDTKDEYTKGHSARVSYYSQKIAEKLGMDEDRVRDIGYIGLMHDVGKLGIPDKILNKPGTLTEDEFNIMKTHTTNGEKMLKDFTAIADILEGALYHHERYDGKGYMAGLAGEDIPLVARIIGVADALDAMNSDRCYRSHLSKDVILSELENNKGSQFDPKIAQIMIDMIHSGEVFVGDVKE
jgi:hypothetical protein